jgi:hypothetical protein
MPVPLRVLVLEDRPSDARLVVHELQQAGFEPLWDRVETEADFVARLEAPWDLILADYSLPQFDAASALHLVRQRNLDIPFIIVSGTIGEELAVAAMKEGAADYLLKDRLSRLGPAVKQALEQRQLRESQRRAALALRESRERTRLILDTAYDAFIAIDAEGLITDWNKQAEVTFGWTRQEAIGRILADTIIPPAQRQSHTAGLARFLVTGEGPVLKRRVELSAVKRDGSEVAVELIVWPVRVGSTWTFSAFVRDITDQKHLAEQLRQSQRMEAVGRLAGGVAHDFNNLLTVILGYSDVSLAQLRPGDPLREFSEEIRKAALRASDLTRQLLAFSRRQVLSPVPLDLNGLLEGVEKMLRRLIGEDIDLAILPAADLWPVRVDPGQVEQVLMNLVVNARDAMPQGGKLTITTTNAELDASYCDTHADAREGEYALLTVSDSGAGIDRQTLAHIFEPFFTTKGPDKGTGLGLATVYGIVKQSGGHVAVYSEPGRGTCFKVYLPRDREAARGSAATAQPASSNHGNETILLVEDEDGVRSLARMVLERHGYQVLEARHGGEALSLCEQTQEPIHLLATDVVMPQMSGRELAERIAPRRPHMKVLYLSGYMDDAIVRHGLLHAEVPFLQKPYTPESLAQKVREVLDRRSA